MASNRPSRGRSRKSNSRSRHRSHLWIIIIWVGTLLPFDDLDYLEFDPNNIDQGASAGVGVGIGSSMSGQRRRHHLWRVTQAAFLSRTYRRKHTLIRPAHPSFSSLAWFGSGSVAMGQSRVLRGKRLFLPAASTAQVSASWSSFPCSMNHDRLNRCGSIRVFASSTDSTDTNSEHAGTAIFLECLKVSLCERIIPHIIQSTKDGASPDGREGTFGLDPVNTTGSSSSQEVSDDSQSNQKPIVLLVAVSGGCDSMGLLHALLDISEPAVVPTLRGDDSTSTTETTHPTRRIHVHDTLSNNGENNLLCEVHVAHFDHCQRGLESEKDANLVKDTCHRHGLPCYVYRWDDFIYGADCDNDIYGKESDKSTTTSSPKFSQDTARKWRQSTLANLLKELTVVDTDKDHPQSPETLIAERAGVILTAHHANDSQETLLLKLLRGVHVQNLSGMKAIHYRETNKTFWGRPLLDVTKDQIRTYLTQQRYVWREDESNKTNKYMRNRVRNELIPLMEGG